MTRRIVIGKRNNGDFGIFVSPPGVDASTASDASLVMNVSSKISQLLMLGRITSSQTVTLGLHRRPYVFITSQWDFSGVIGHTTGPGPLRPSPPPFGTPSTATINSNGASVSFSIAYPTVFQIYSLAYT